MSRSSVLADTTLQPSDISLTEEKSQQAKAIDQSHCKVFSLSPSLSLPSVSPAHLHLPLNTKSISPTASIPKTDQRAPLDENTTRQPLASPYKSQTTKPSFLTTTQLRPTASHSLAPTTEHTHQLEQKARRERHAPAKSPNPLSFSTKPVR